MAWIDDRFWAHRKVIGLTDRAFRAYVNGLCYASGMGTRGHLDAATIKLIGARKREKNELVSHELWHENGASGVSINDWDEHNDKRDKRKAADRERKRLARAKERVAEATASAGQSADNTADCPQDVHKTVRRTVGGQSAPGPHAEEVKEVKSEETPPTPTLPKDAAELVARTAQALDDIPF